VKIGAERGRLISTPPASAKVLITAHPSSLLRIREAKDKESAWAAFVNDLRLLTNFRRQRL
jgi:hypothetical protein